jgi:TonB family protein
MVSNFQFKVTDCFRSAGFAAFIMQGFIIGILAVAIHVPPGTGTQSPSKHDFQANILFTSPEDKPVFQPNQVNKPLQESPAILTEIPDNPVTAPVSSLSFPAQKKQTVNTTYTVKTHTVGKREKKKENPFSEPASRSSTFHGWAQNTTPVALFTPPPKYPLVARQQKIQGTVLLKLLIAESGAVSKVVPLAPHTHPLLEQAAIHAVQKWRFCNTHTPLEIPVEFRLRE